MESKFFKHPKQKRVIEVTDLNTINLYLREGFIEVDAKGNPIEKENEDKKDIE